MNVLACTANNNTYKTFQSQEAGGVCFYTMPSHGWELREQTNRNMFPLRNGMNPTSCDHLVAPTLVPESTLPISLECECKSAEEIQSLRALCCSVLRTVLEAATSWGAGITFWVWPFSSFYPSCLEKNLSMLVTEQALKLVVHGGEAKKLYCHNASFIIQSTSSLNDISATNSKNQKCEGQKTLFFFV